MHVAAFVDDPETGLRRTFELVKRGTAKNNLLSVGRGSEFGGVPNAAERRLVRLAKILPDFPVARMFAQVARIRPVHDWSVLPTEGR